MDNQFFRNHGRTGQRSPISKIEPWASYVGGGVLTAFGISRKSVAGAAIAAAGGWLIYRAATYSQGPQRVHAQRTVTIMKPVADVFNYWRNFENLPHIMTHLENVRTIDQRYSHWTARGPANSRFEWDAEIVEERANEFIVWRSCAGSEIENRGSVQFVSSLNGQATELCVALDYTPPAGKLGAAFARLFGENPEQQIREDLRHFKAVMETGEAPTTEGQAHGRRSAWVRTMQRAYAEKKKPQPAENVREFQPAQSRA